VQTAQTPPAPLPIQEALPANTPVAQEPSAPVPSPTVVASSPVYTPPVAQAPVAQEPPAQAPSPTVVASPPAYTPPVTQVPAAPPVTQTQTAPVVAQPPAPAPAVQQPAFVPVAFHVRLTPEINIVQDKSYRLQVGSYKVARNAVDAFERLKNAGLSPAYERFTDSAGVEYFRVVLAGVRGSDVQLTADKLGTAGFREALVREEN